MTKKELEEIKIVVKSSDLSVAQVTVTGKNSEVDTCKMDVWRIAGMLDQNLKRESYLEYDHVGRMPTGYYDMKFADNKNFYIACLLESSVCPYHYMVSGKQQVFLIPFPATLFLFWVENGKEKLSHCHAVDKNGQICKYPFPNVYESGRICWGNCHLPDINCPGDVNKLMDTFLMAGFNTHLYSESNTSLGVSIEELIRHLEPLNEFPENILLKKNVNVSKVVEEFFKE